MDYSRWNYGTRKYDYYKVGQYDGTHVTKPTIHALTGSQIGMTPDEFAARLPQGAVKVGMGDAAKGRIVSTGDFSGLGNWVIYGVVAYLAWRMFR